MCKMGMIRQSCFTLSGLSILESKSTFSFKIFCPLLSEETFSDSWKYAFGLPVFWMKNQTVSYSRRSIIF